MWIRRIVVWQLIDHNITIIKGRIRVTIISYNESISNRIHFSPYLLAHFKWLRIGVHENAIIIDRADHQLMKGDECS
jgi:hypothetical protein